MIRDSSSCVGAGELRTRPVIRFTMRKQNQMLEMWISDDSAKAT
jgi:hypothetical protein